MTNKEQKYQEALKMFNEAFEKIYNSLQEDKDNLKVSMNEPLSKWHKVARIMGVNTYEDVMDNMDGSVDWDKRYYCEYITTVGDFFDRTLMTEEGVCNAAQEVISDEHLGLYVHDLDSDTWEEPIDNFRVVLLG
jgi:hypothetical protein